MNFRPSFITATALAVAFAFTARASQAAPAGTAAVPAATGGAPASVPSGVALQLAQASLAAPARPAWVAGEVRKVDARAGTVTIRHERIANLDMDAMTMVFKAKPPTLLDGLKPGDRLRFTADMADGELVLTAIER